MGGVLPEQAGILFSFIERVYGSQNAGMMGMEG